MLRVALSADRERIEVQSLVQFEAFDRFDVRSGRPGAHRNQQTAHAVDGSSCTNLDAAIRQVTHVPEDPEPTRRLQHVVSKPDALDPARDPPLRTGPLGRKVPIVNLAHLPKPLEIGGYRNGSSYGTLGGCARNGLPGVQARRRRAYSRIAAAALAEKESTRLDIGMLTK
jgi:hypothetical protein